ncbi:DUF948 domain-containing protein [Cohnella sp. JJ-181]|uniref:DUF948 domain-containing protein n=1 Tax=Cohnella rhizoplanae TaxID=2974897 RepID=UPI0022FF8235|nr:DUF948 domain-containing protein [Cohnella sp. JJ-181]CAI6087287.1 hypothetical protein COHCIP112018_05431 [Cohnella sp. JJ-181]
MVIQISVAVAAIAFAGLALYLIQTLRKGMITLGETNKTLAEVRNAVHGLTGEASQLIRSANQVTRDVKGKIQTIDPLLESVHDVGEVIQTVTESVKKAAGIPPAPERIAPGSASPQLRVKVK